jgi:hypothetical protein
MRLLGSELMVAWLSAVKTRHWRSALHDMTLTTKDIKATATFF